MNVKNAVIQVSFLTAVTLLAGALGHVIGKKFPLYE